MPDDLVQMRGFLRRACINVVVNPDKLGGLALTIEGLKERDRMVFRSAQSAGARVFSVYAGGYAMRLEDTVMIHANTVLAAAEVFSFHGATSC